MQNLLSRTLRTIALVLSLALTLDQLAYAADLPVSISSSLPEAPLPAQYVPGPPQPNPPALPGQILNAHTVFLSNAGAGNGFPGSADDSYAVFYNDLRDWGHFQLVDSPANADLIFQLRSSAPIGGVTVVDGTGSSYRNPMLILSIVDPKSQTLLWSISSPVYTPLSKKDKTDWFSISVLDLTTRVKLLTGAPITAQESAYLNQTPQYHHSHLVWLWALAPAAVVGGVVAVVIHENNVYNDFATKNGLTCATNPFFCNP